MPPHPVLLPERRRDPRNIPNGCSRVLSPLGERDRVRGASRSHPAVSYHPRFFSSLPEPCDRMAQHCGDYFFVCGDKSQFAESSNCAGLPLGGRSFSRVLLPLRGLQSPLVRAAMPVGQQGVNPGVRDVLILTTVWRRLQGSAQSQLPHGRNLRWPRGVARTAKSGFPLRRGKPHSRLPASADPNLALECARKSVGGFPIRRTINKVRPEKCEAVFR